MRELIAVQNTGLPPTCCFNCSRARLPLKQLASTFCNGDIQDGMTVLARTLNELRRSLHVEFVSHAAFGATSPYADFEGPPAGNAPDEKETSPTGS
jgi:hypothetical protein